jgi:SAM-dependent methyltransferase
MSVMDQRREQRENPVGVLRSAASNALRGTLEAHRLWRASRLVGAEQRLLNSCPCCAEPGGEMLYDTNSFSRYAFVSRTLKSGRYTLCHRCGVIYAATRSTPEGAQSFYDLFTSTQDNRHDVYPPRSRNSKGKLNAAHTLLDHLKTRNLLKAGMSLLHLRCDAGALLREFKQRVPDGIAHGLDYFDPNLRYLKETGLVAARLNSGTLDVPFATAYDVIVSNHIFTHALEPHRDMLKLRTLLKPGGRVLFYNEVDHNLLLNPQSAHYIRSDIISYHKQLFVRESFENFLKLTGFEFEFLGNRGVGLVHLGWAGASMTNVPRAHPSVLEHQRSLVSKWKRQIAWRRPLVMIKHTTKWLLLRPHKEHV